MNYSKYLLILLFVLAISRGMFAIPRFALRMGAQCVDCHISPTGGEMRNKGGWHYGLRALPLISPREKDDALNMSNEIGKNIDIGFDYRTQYLYSQELQKTTFQKMQGAIYIDAKIMDSIDVYANYDFVNANWEGFVVAHILPNSSYIKVGTFVPDFGVWLDDHTAYTRGGDLGYLFTMNQRQGSIYDSRYNITGVEAGFNISDFALFTASVGSPVSLNFNSDPTYTTSIKFTPVIENTLALMFGGSYSIFKGPLIYTQVPSEHKVNMFGGFAGFGIGNFTLLGEYDLLQDYILTGTKSTAQMVEASYVLLKGLEAVVRYDRFDPNTSVTNDDVSRLNVGFSFYPYSFVEIIPQYRFQFETPSVKNDSFLLQFHFFY
ncbi:MAG: hypothetical protein P4L45_08595 [Ignavibacteriaceae bacterium]|nr:hypothetical protein [Ignavibacteriaceae bacterium]